MTPQTTSAELMTPGEIRAALNAYDVAEARREAERERADPARVPRAVIGWCLACAMLECLAAAAWCAAVGR